MRKGLTVVGREGNYRVIVRDPRKRSPVADHDGLTQADALELAGMYRRLGWELVTIAVGETVDDDLIA